MNKILEKVKNYPVPPISAGLSITIALLIVGIFFSFLFLSNKISKLEEFSFKENSELNKKITDIETVLLATQEENLTFTEALEKAQDDAKKLEREFEKVNDNVEDLETLAKTDGELLKKYSNVFFLNENYIPIDVKKIPSEFTYNSNRIYEIHEEVYPYLIDLLEEAEDDDIDLQVISAFRSFGEQTQLKGAYTVTYGAGTANQFSADQGYSEHQLGTTIDFTNNQVGATFSGFSSSDTYLWLQNNAHKYGFVLSYPENNQFFQFEPWHWRFVGKDLADDLHDKDKNFYDLTQREIDKYIIKLFD